MTSPIALPASTSTIATTTRTRSSASSLGHSIGRKRHRMAKLPLSFGSGVQCGVHLSQVGGGVARSNAIGETIGTMR